MYRTARTALALATLATGLMIGAAAHAMKIEVSQESAAGAGDFNANVLGLIDPYSTGLTTAGFYQYNNPDAASYNGQLNGGPAPLSGVTQIFLVNASDGLSLVVVHDQPNDSSGGSTRMRWNLTGDTAAELVSDDEALVVSGGGTQFDSTKNWVACCTDGYAIGSLDGGWEMFGQFITFPTGINLWQATSSGSPDIGLTLSPGRQVRLRAIPEPTTLAIIGIGLAGLGIARRRRRA